MLRRNRPGSKRTEMWTWGFEGYTQGPFDIQEYIQVLIRRDPSQLELLIEPPEWVEVNAWIYEHIRQFVLELNSLVVRLMPVCNKLTCPTMKADTYLYLCASHPTPQECPAIDYMTHTIDHSISILHHKKYFESRVNISPNCTKHFASIVRRLYRLFAHAYFHHRDLYIEVENMSFLCGRFTVFAKRFDLMPAKFFNIPEYIH